MLTVPAPFAIGDRDQKMSSRRPIRTCIGCRQRVASTELLRVVVAPGSTSTALAAPIVPDPRRRLPGRGAWLHPSSSCLDLATRRRAFARALRTNGSIDPAALGEYLSQAEHSTTG